MWFGRYLTLQTIVLTLSLGHKVVAVAATAGELEFVTAARALVEVPTAGDLIALTSHWRQRAGIIHIVARILALLLAGIVVLVAAAARVDELIAKSILVVVVPTRYALVTVAGFRGLVALAGINWLLWLLFYIVNATCRAILFSIETILVAAAASVVELLAVTAGRVVAPLKLPVIAITHRSG